MNEQNETSLIDVNLDDQQDIVTLPADTEIELRVQNASVEERKKLPGRYNLKLVLEDPTDPLVEYISVWIGMPCSADRDDDIRKYSKACERWKGMLAAFGLESTPRDARDFVGQNVTVIVGSETDPQYGTRNTVKRWVSNAR